MKRIFLVRHATNDWVGKRLAGRLPGVHLNAEGKQQAEALAERLYVEHMRHAFRAIYSSPMERAVETATPLSQRIGLSINLLDAVIEVDFGAWEGRELKALRDEPLWRVVQQTPSRMRFPGGESVAEMQQRAVAGVEQVVATLGEKERAIIVAHSDVIKAIIAWYSGTHLDHFQRFVVSPASISVIGFPKEGVPHVLSVNDTAHVPRPWVPEAANGEADNG
nr:MSMEG_4193 family putative phosphomutase [Ardenticatena sp.]